MKNKIRLIGGVAIALAIISSYIQSNFYGYVDANDVLRDSIFLPLSFIFAFLGVLFIGISFFIPRKRKQDG